MIFISLVHKKSGSFTTTTMSATLQGQRHLFGSQYRGLISVGIIHVERPGESAYIKRRFKKKISLIELKRHNFFSYDLGNLIVYLPMIWTVDPLRVLHHRAAPYHTKSRGYAGWCCPDTRLNCLHAKVSGETACNQKRRELVGQPNRSQWQPSGKIEWTH